MVVNPDCNEVPSKTNQQLPLTLYELSVHRRNCEYIDILMSTQQDLSVHTRNCQQPVRIVRTTQDLSVHGRNCQHIMSCQCTVELGQYMVGIANTVLELSVNHRNYWHTGIVSTLGIVSKSTTIQFRLVTEATFLGQVWYIPSNCYELYM